jgi:hypothetical protein
MRLLRSQTARWRSRPAGIVDLPCCYILLRVIGTIQFCVFEQEDDERFVDFRPKQWSGFLVNEGAHRFECGDRSGCVMSSFGSLVEQKQGVQRRFSMKRLVNVKWHAC